MSNYTSIDFTPLDALTGDEVVTHSPVRDVRLPSGNVLALITLDNVVATTPRPTRWTCDPRRARADARDAQEARRRRRDPRRRDPGKQYILAAGADLSDVAKLPSKRSRASSHSADTR